MPYPGLDRAFPRLPALADRGKLGENAFQSTGTNYGFTPDSQSTGLTPDSSPTAGYSPDPDQETEIVIDEPAWVGDRLHPCGRVVLDGKAKNQSALESIEAAIAEHSNRSTRLGSLARSIRNRPARWRWLETDEKASAADVLHDINAVGWLLCRCREDLDKTTASCDERFDEIHRIVDEILPEP